MSNLDKHKHNLVHEWLEGEEGTEPAQPRSAHLTGGRTDKPAKRRFRAPALNGSASKTDPALMREPAQVRPEEKPSQASAPEHLRKLKRLARLRAPQYRTKG